MKAWSYVCKNSSENVPDDLCPCLDRTVIKDPLGLETVYLNHWSSLATELGLSQDPRSLKRLSQVRERTILVRSTFQLTRGNIHKLKKMVSSQWNMNLEGHHLHVSTFVVTCAYTSVCMVKALGEGDEKRKILILFSADCRGRTRLDPPVPSNYFGNCIRVLDMLAIATDFTEENAVSIVAKRIGDVIKGMENGGVLEGAEKMMLKIKDLKDLQTISVAGSIRFEVYGMDFGWGRPKKVEVTSIDRCGGGTMFLNQSRHGEGEGVEVGLALIRQEMEAFACHFVNGLNVQGWLQTSYSS